MPEVFVAHLILPEKMMYVWLTWRVRMLRAGTCDSVTSV